MLDHLLWGVANLDDGLDDIAERCGVRAVHGGSHPGVGTHNALLDLEDRRYLEIIGPDPGQDRFSGFGLLLRELRTSGLLTWAARTDDIESVAENARGAGLEPGEIYAMSRRRPDGEMLKGRLLQLAGHPWGMLLPFFIQFDSSVHPSYDAPRGCRLESFVLTHPQAPELHQLLAHLGLDTEVQSGPIPGLLAIVDSPRGPVELSGPPNDQPNKDS